MAKNSPKSARPMEPVWEDPRSVVNTKVLGWIAFIILVLGAAALALFVDSRFIVAGVIGVVGMVLVIRYPFVGFLIYLTIYFLRPGERIIALAPLRIELLYGVLLLVSIILADAIRGRGFRFPRDKVSVSLMAFIAALGLSTIFSEWVMQSYEAVINFVKTFILYYFIVVLVKTRRRFDIVFWIMVLLTVGIGAESLKDYLSGNYHFSQGIMRAAGATSVGGHPNSLAMYMATTVPMLVYLFARFKSIGSRLVLIAMVAVCFVVLLYTGSRGGVLCIATIGFTYAWFAKQRTVWIVALVCLAVATWFALPEQYQTRYSSMTESEVDASTQGRFDAWKAGMQMVSEKPLTGVGPRVFAAAYSTRKGVWLYSHSLYIELLASTGIIGTATWVAFLLFLLGVLKRMKQQALVADTDKVKLAVFTNANYAMIAGLLVAGVFAHILFRDTWYIVGALVVAHGRVAETELPKPDGEGFDGSA